MLVADTSLITQTAFWLSVLALTVVAISHLKLLQRHKQNSSFMGYLPYEADYSFYRPHFSANLKDQNFDLIDRLRLEEQVKIAVDSSLLSSSVVGVILLQPSHNFDKSNIMKFDVLKGMINSVRLHLSNSDFLHVTKDYEIIAFVSKIKHRAVLENISCTLHEEVNAQLLVLNTKLKYSLGIAMYPIDGYEADDLIHSARSNLKKSRSELLNA